MVLLTPSFSSESHGIIEGPIEPCWDHLETTGGIDLRAQRCLQLVPRAELIGMLDHADAEQW